MIVITLSCFVWNWKLIITDREELNWEILINSSVRNWDTFVFKILREKWMTWQKVDIIILSWTGDREVKEIVFVTGSSCCVWVVRRNLWRSETWEMRVVQPGSVLTEYCQMRWGELWTHKHILCRVSRAWPSNTSHSVGSKLFDRETELVRSVVCVSECWHYPATIITDWVRSDCCCWQEIISSNWSSQFSSVVSHPETSPAHTTTQHCSHCQLWSYQSRLRAEIFQNLAQLIVAEFVRLHCSVWSVTNSISLIFYVYIPHPAASHRGDENKTEFSSLCKCNDVVLNLTQVSSRRMRGGSLCLVILVSKLWTHKHILQNFLTNTSRC